MASPRLLTHDGKTQSIAAWAKQLKISRDTIQSRLDRDGWSIEKALSVAPGADNLSQNSTRIARELRTDLLTDLKRMHAEYGAKALLDACKKECEEGRAIKLYRELIVPLFPKEEQRENDTPQVAVNIISADQLTTMLSHKGGS